MATKKHKSVWRVWALSLGEKAGKDDREADRVATIRSLIFLSYLATNIFIMAGVVRQWPNGGTRALTPLVGQSTSCHTPPSFPPRSVIE
jgi:hypothetical protein